MRSEWGCTLRQALFEESVAAAMVLWPAVLARHGVENTGMDYVTRARQKAKEKARKWISDNYQVEAQGKRHEASVAAAPVAAGADRGFIPGADRGR